MFLVIFQIFEYSIQIIEYSIEYSTWFSYSNIEYLNVFIFEYSNIRFHPYSTRILIIRFYISGEYFSENSFLCLLKKCAKHSWTYITLWKRNIDYEVLRFHGIKKPVKIITFIVGIREPNIYVTILFAEYKITLSKSNWNSLFENIKRTLLQKVGKKIINSAKNEIETPLFIFWFLIAW
jgi:hypothetical protein